MFGGKFCRRASNFGDSAVPSEMARKHRGVRAAIIYEFGAKFSGEREARKERKAAAREFEGSRLKAGSRRKGDDEEVGTAPKRVDSDSHLLRRERKREHKKGPR